ncbi:hypothetical protein bwei_1631 [Bacillus mycoides]|nr:hypothetical protein bwei_1631 [Bacillus mycoides]EEL05339.1 hypothetical protein bcere0014_30650 [Bacillus cereus BDRD-ST196]
MTKTEIEKNALYTRERDGHRRICPSNDSLCKNQIIEKGY